MLNANVFRKKKADLDALQDVEDGWGGEDLPADTRVVLAEEQPFVDLPKHTAVTYAPGAESYRPEAEERVVQVDTSPDMAALEAARGEDVDAFNSRVREMALRQLVGSITRTAPADAVTPLGTSEKDLRAQMAQRRADALRELEMGNEKTRADTYAAQVRGGFEGNASKTDRLKTQQELEREKLDEQKRRAMADEDLRSRALDFKERMGSKPKAVKPAPGPKPMDVSGLPYGWEVPTDSTTTRQQREKFAGTVQSAEKMRGLTSQMRKLLTETGGGRYLPGEARTKVSQLATLIQLEAKNVAELGALSGPDMALMNAVASNPTALDSVVRDIPALLDGLDGWAENSIQAGASTLGARKKGAGAPAAATPAADGDVTLVDDSGAEFDVPAAKVDAILKAKPNLRRK